MRNPSISELYLDAISEKNNITIANSGAMIAYSGKYTGRKPDWKHFVNNESYNKISCNPQNKTISETVFNKAKNIAINYINSLEHYNNQYTKEKKYIIESYINWHQTIKYKVRFYTNNPYHALFFMNMTIVSDQKFSDEEINLTIYDAGSIDYPKDDDYKNEGLVGFNLETNEIVILGTQYAGEIKKGMFTFMMYKMPLLDYLPLHSSANIGENDDVTLFFGLSGTGKTTLSTEPHRRLIGDDEHVWCDDGIFNIEGGCYAKCIGLEKDKEPEIFRAIKFGSVIENIPSISGNIDFNDTSITANTRCAYPLQHIDNAVIPASVPHHPKNIILLSCDAHGLMPPVAKLTPEQALFFFINGYTSKVANTEDGIVEPEITFSACFGEPFLVHHPIIYRDLLKKYLDKHGTTVWFLNTGWIKGDHKTGERISIKYSREIIDKIHDGTLLKEEFEEYPYFDFMIPKACGEIPENVLNPQIYWENSPIYMKRLEDLYLKFQKNYEKYQTN